MQGTDRPWHLAALGQREHWVEPDGRRVAVADLTDVQAAACLRWLFAHRWRIWSACALGQVDVADLSAASDLALALHGGAPLVADVPPEVWLDHLPLPAALRQVAGMPAGLWPDRQLAPTAADVLADLDADLEAQDLRLAGRDAAPTLRRLVPLAGKLRRAGQQHAALAAAQAAVTVHRSLQSGRHQPRPAPHDDGWPV